MGRSPNHPLSRRPGNMLPAPCGPTRSQAAAAIISGRACAAWNMPGMWCFIGSKRAASWFLAYFISACCQKHRASTKRNLGITSNKVSNWALALAGSRAQHFPDRGFRSSVRSPKCRAPHTVCPECGHAFRGNDGDGIDGHWRAKHEQWLSYEDFGRLLCPRHCG